MTPPYPPKPGYSYRGWTSNDFTVVNGALRERLFRRRLDIEIGWQPDLRTAVKAAAVVAAEARKRSVDKVRYAWLLKRFIANRRKVLAGSPMCVYCAARPAVGVDHVVPRARGGTDALSNLVPACRMCNSEKWTRSVAEWQEWRLRRGRPWPPRWDFSQVRPPETLSNPRNDGC